MRTRTARSWPRYAAAGAALTLLAACAPGGGSSDDGDGAAAPEEIETEVSELGEVTLTVWDQEVRGGQADQMERLNAAFEEEYPNITVERVPYATEDLANTLRLALDDGDDAPDVVQANNGRSDMGQYVAANMLVPLDSYAQEYGWDDRFPESLRSLAMYSDDGETFGEGDLYGLPQMGEIVGLYYSKPKLEQLGLEVPGTTEELVAALSAAQEAGEVPIQFGYQNDAWAGIHQYGFVHNQYVADPEDIRNLGFGRAGSSWLSEDNVEAAEAIVDWVDEGYFDDGFTGQDYDTAWGRFADGDGVFFVGGTWLLADLAEAMGEDVGFALPPAGASGQQVVTGGISIPFAIPANSDNPDAAAAYIDFITSEEAMEIITEAGNLPVTGADQQEAAGLQREVFDAWAQAGEEDLVVPYLDYATPTFYDTITAAIQDLLSEQRSPEDFLAHLEDAYLEQAEG